MQPVAIGDYSVGRVTELQFSPFAATEFFPAATNEMVEAARRALPGRIADYGIERFYRDVRLFRLYEGTSQIQQLIIARQMLERAKA